MRQSAALTRRTSRRARQRKRNRTKERVSGDVMKRAVMLWAVITVAALAVAQTAGTQQQKPPAPSGAQAAPGQQPAAATPPAQPAGPSGSRRPPQAKNQDEFKAFQEANAKTAPAETEAAADAFAQKFPDSE